LDLASGGGRHARYLAGLGHRVEAVDIAAPAQGIPGVTVCQADLESGDWPYEKERFAGIVVVNYLHRPLFPKILQALSPGGVLIYETFAVGQEKYGRPRNPDHLLRLGELLEVARGKLKIVAYEDVEEREPRPACRQRICAVKDSDGL
jgi:SAM-dependent methyltransferase